MRKTVKAMLLLSVLTLFSFMLIYGLPGMISVSPMLYGLFIALYYDKKNWREMRLLDIRLMRVVGKTVFAVSVFFLSLCIMKTVVLLEYVSSDPLLRGHYELVAPYMLLSMLFTAYIVYSIGMMRAVLEKRAEG